MRRLMLPFAVLLLLVAGACASAGGSGTSRNSNRITAEELETVATFSAYEAVRRLRPAWLRVRTQAAPPVVFLDGVQMGGPETLENFRASQFREILHRSGPDATTLYGTGVAGGTIELVSR